MEGEERSGTHRRSPVLQLCFPPQDGAPREARTGLLQLLLSSWVGCNHTSQNLLLCEGFPSFHLFYPLLCYLVLKKARWGYPRLQNASDWVGSRCGGRRDSGERAVPACFPSFSELPSSPRLASPPRSPLGQGILKALRPSLKGFPIPILQSWIVRVKK